MNRSRPPNLWSRLSEKASAGTGAPAAPISDTERIDGPSNTAHLSGALHPSAAASVLRGTRPSLASTSPHTLKSP